MSEQLPYNEDQWHELPLPDSETSWQKMELLLDKDKKRRVPFWWWRYAALALLLAGIGTGGWLWLTPGDKKTESATTENKNINLPKEEQKDVVILNKDKTTKTPANSSVENSSIPVYHSPQKKTGENTPEVSKPKSNEAVVLLKTKRTTKTSQKTKAAPLSKTKAPSETQNSENSIVKKDKSNPIIVSTDTKTSSTDSIAINKEVKDRSINTKDSASAIIAPPVLNNEDKKDEKKKKSSFVWSAGIGLQQSIAVKGQESSSYNYNGKQSSLSDHIPSVYLRLQKDKWFAQVEFQYAAPQPVENFYFSQKTRYDVANLSINTERFIIQKLYYHQLPLSINYHLHKNLSVGVGGMYSILAGAVTQQEITSKNMQTGSETITHNLAPVKGFKDSFLYKTTAGILLQTDYHWKRFSLGLRYTQNFQPFIKYTKPDGTILDEKTQALQAVLRFRLWSSK